jgi:hypothetical protein
MILYSHWKNSGAILTTTTFYRLHAQIKDDFFFFNGGCVGKYLKAIYRLIHITLRP